MVTAYEDIVTHNDSPTLVLAGPGAGKTYLLADRVKRLLGDGINKECITVLTFGRDTKQHMYNTLVDRNGAFRLAQNALPRISTMHSLGFEILNERPREVGLRKADLRVQEDEAIKRLIYRDAALLLGRSADDATKACACKQRGDCREDKRTKKCAICDKYWEIMAKCNRVDFDDQVLFACRILERRPELLAKYQTRAQHLLVDEYQDINAAQFRLIELLSRTSRNGLFVVGDDAQSIYGFRGADPGFILRFGSDFPTAKTPPLGHSRRCHQQTMEAAAKVLKSYYSAWTGPHRLKYDRPAGEPPAVWQLPSELAEAEMVARSARRFLSEKKTVLILAPKKDFFPLISKELRRRGVPHDCPINLLPRSVNERLRVVRLFTQWIQDAEDNFPTRLAIEELINKGCAKVPGAAKDNRCRPETIRQRVEEETRIARLWEGVDGHTTLYSVVGAREGGTGALPKVRDALTAVLEAYINFKCQEQGEFLKKLSAATGVWVDPSHLAEDMRCIDSLLDTPSTTGAGFAQMMTMRKAKGLEADVVIIVGLEDDIIPSPAADVQEEARLFYVSMTRAIEKLFLFHAFKRPRSVSFGAELSGKPRSKFLDALGIPSPTSAVEAILRLF